MFKDQDHEVFITRADFGNEKISISTKSTGWTTISISTYDPVDKKITKVEAVLSSTALRSMSEKLIEAAIEAEEALNKKHNNAAKPAVSGFKNV